MILIPVIVFALWETQPAVWQSLVVCDAWTRWVGVPVLLLATAFTVWARVILGTMWSSMPVQRAGHKLRTDGPYQVTRHPIYTGLIAMVVGSALIGGIGIMGPIVVIVAGGLMLKLRAEERLMREAFGDAYVSYQRRVPALLPWPRSRNSRR